MTRFCIRQDCIGGVVFVKRFEDNYLFLRVDGSHHRCDHSFSGTAGDGNFCFRIDVEPEVPFCFSGYRFAEIARTPGDCILINIVFDSLHRDTLNVFRRREIRKALRQVHRAVLECFTRHLANYGLGEETRFFRNVSISS